MTAPYPRFGDAEMMRRRAALEAVMAEHDVAHLLVYGANRFGTAVGWLTRWPVTREALVVVTPGERDALFVDFFNHVPNAQRIATEADVRPAAPLGIANAVADALSPFGVTITRFPLRPEMILELIAPFSTQ